MLYIDRDQAVRPNEDENNLAPQRVGIPEKSLDEHRVHVGAEDTQDTIAFPFDEGTLLQHEQYAIRSQQSPPGKKPPGTQAIDPILPAAAKQRLLRLLLLCAVLTFPKAGAGALSWGSLVETASNSSRGSDTARKSIVYAPGAELVDKLFAGLEGGVLQLANKLVERFAVHAPSLPLRLHVVGGINKQQNAPGLRSSEN